jgi:hypothetical protein
MHARRRAAAALVLTVSVLLAGCGKPATAPTATETLNQDKPNANDQIVTQGTFGDANSYSYLSALAFGDDGNYAFQGYVNGERGAGSLTAAGALRWFKSFSYVPRGVFVMPATSIAPNDVLVVGKHSTDADDESEQGDVSLYGSTGDLLGHIVLSSDSSDVFVNAAVPLTDSTFLAVGGERISGVEWPWLVQIIVRAGGQLVRGADAVLRSQMPSRYLTDVAALPPAGGDIRLFVISTSDENLDRVDALRITEGTIAPAAVDWNRDVPPPHAGQVALSGIAANVSEVYAAGFADDDRKGATSGGGYWTSALMASFTATGDPRWQTVVSLTGHDDYFQDVLIGTGTIYGVGASASFLYSGRDQFGYGLLTRLDPATGAAQGNQTFGSDRYQSEFETALLKGSNVLAGGWTAYEVRGGPSQGWLAELKPTALISAGAVPSSAVNRAMPGDGSSPLRARHAVSAWARSGRR